MSATPKEEPEAKAIRFNPYFGATTRVPQLIKGPCIICGYQVYPLSMGGPTICPSCDCGISPKDPAHMRNRFQLSSQEAVAPPSAPKG